MTKKIMLIMLIVLLLFKINVFAHGALIEYEIKESYYIQALYDTGKPMPFAQIIIYAPNNIEEPYEVGKSNENGEYSFTIDKNIKGVWTIQARLVGHGTSMNILVNDNVMVKQSKVSIIQMIIMGGCVLWGLFGTYMYFSRR